METNLSYSPLKPYYIKNNDVQFEASNSICDDLYASNGSENGQRVTKNPEDISGNVITDNKKEFLRDNFSDLFYGQGDLNISKNIIHDIFGDVYIKRLMNRSTVQDEEKFDFQSNVSTGLSLLPKIVASQVENEKIVINASETDNSTLLQSTCTYDSFTFSPFGEDITVEDLSYEFSLEKPRKNITVDGKSLSAQEYLSKQFGSSISDVYNDASTKGFRVEKKFTIPENSSPTNKEKFNDMFFFQQLLNLDDASLTSTKSSDSSAEGLDENTHFLRKYYNDNKDRLKESYPATFAMALDKNFFNDFLSYLSYIGSLYTKNVGKKDESAFIKGSLNLFKILYVDNGDLYSQLERDERNYIVEKYANPVHGKNLSIKYFDMGYDHLNALVKKDMEEIVSDKKRAQRFKIAGMFCFALAVVVPIITPYVLPGLFVYGLSVGVFLVAASVYCAVKSGYTLNSNKNKVANSSIAQSADEPPANNLSEGLSI